MIWLVAALLFAISLIPSNIDAVMEYANRVWIRYVFPINIVAMPILMLTIGRLRRIPG